MFLIICLVSSVTFTYQMFFTLHELFRWSYAYAISEYKHMHNRKTLVWHYFLLLQSVRNGQTSPPTHAQELVRNSVKSRNIKEDSLYFHITEKTVTCLLHL